MNKGPPTRYARFKSYCFPSVHRQIRYFFGKSVHRSLHLPPFQSKLVLMQALTTGIAVTVGSGANIAAFPLGGSQEDVTIHGELIIKVTTGHLWYLDEHSTVFSNNTEREKLLDRPTSDSQGVVRNADMRESLTYVFSQSLHLSTACTTQHSFTASGFHCMFADESWRVFEL